MVEILCESIDRGLRADERSVCVRNAVTGLRSSLRVPADYLTFHEGKYYLPVGVIQEEPQRGLVLVELTQEPDTGPTRLWVRTSDLLPTEKVGT
jgi:hypothetical protein